MYEERGGSLTRDGNLGVDSLVLRVDLIESQEEIFRANQPPVLSFFFCSRPNFRAAKTSTFARKPHGNAFYAG